MRAHQTIEHGTTKHAISTIAPCSGTLQQLPSWGHSRKQTRSIATANFRNRHYTLHIDTCYALLAVNSMYLCNVIKSLHFV